MKALVVLLVVLCATACADRGKPGDHATVKVPGGPEFRFSGSPYAITITGSSLQATHMGRKVRYEAGSLYVDERLVTLPDRAHVIELDGSAIVVDGLNLTN
jgi:hypothetical protein